MMPGPRVRRRDAPQAAPPDQGDSGCRAARLALSRLALATALAAGCGGGGSSAPSAGCTDPDGDGFGTGATCAGPDCAEGDPLRWRTLTAHPDADGDGFGAAALATVCAGAALPAGWVQDGTDCDDRAASVHPGQPEVCGNGVDDDCDGLVDAADVVDCPPGCADADADGDGYGVGQGCLGPDCDDANPAVHPGAVELVADGVDESCDGRETCYVDADGDGWRPSATATVVSYDASCLGPGEATAAVPVGDCDDANPAVHLQVCGDGIACGTEACDEGAANSDAYAPARHCNATCTGWAAYCGDGTVDAGVEACDDRTNNGDGWSVLPHCRADCQGLAPHCGDGVLQAGEACEGTDLAGLQCASFPDDDAGALACTPSCTLELAGCTGPYSPGAWYGLGGSDIGTQATRLAGSASGCGVTVAGTSYRGASRPDVAVDAAGHLVIAWAEADLYDAYVYVLRHDGTGWRELGGSASGTGISTAGAKAATPSVALYANGYPVVAWASTSGTTTEIYVKSWNGTSWVELAGSASRYGISDSPSYASVEPDVAVDHAQRPVVVWQENKVEYYAGYYYGTVFAKRFDGARWEELAGSATGYGISTFPSHKWGDAPRVVVDAAGRVGSLRGVPHRRRRQRDRDRLPPPDPRHRRRGAAGRRLVREGRDGGADLRAPARRDGMGGARRLRLGARGERQPRGRALPRARGSRRRAGRRLAERDDHLRHLHVPASLGRRRLERAGSAAAARRPEPRGHGPLLPARRRRAGRQARRRGARAPRRERQPVRPGVRRGRLGRARGIGRGDGREPDGRARPRAGARGRRRGPPGDGVEREQRLAVRDLASPVGRRRVGRAGRVGDGPGRERGRLRGYPRGRARRLGPAGRRVAGDPRDGHVRRVPPALGRERVDGARRLGDGRGRERHDVHPHDPRGRGGRRRARARRVGLGGRDLRAALGRRGVGRARVVGERGRAERERRQLGDARRRVRRRRPPGRGVARERRRRDVPRLPPAVRRCVVGRARRLGDGRRRGRLPRGRRRAGARDRRRGEPRRRLAPGGRRRPRDLREALDGAAWTHLGGSDRGGGVSNSRSGSSSPSLSARGGRICVAWYEDATHAPQLLLRCVDDP